MERMIEKKKRPENRRRCSAEEWLTSNMFAIEIMTAESTNGMAGNAISWTKDIPMSLKEVASEAGATLPKITANGST